MKRIFLFLVLAGVARADRLPDWLKLPAVSEARPADASIWILHDATTITQEKPDVIRRRHRYAQMTLSHAGVKNSACLERLTTGIEKLAFAKAWVCSPDGKIVREFGGTDFFLVSPTVSRWVWDQETNAFFYAQRFLEVGWVFAYEVEIESEYATHDHRWYPGSTDVPVRFESYEVVPMPGGRVVWQSFPENALVPSTSTNGALTWRTSGSSPIYRPNVPTAVEARRTQMCFYFVPPDDKATGRKTWAEVANLVRSQMDPKVTRTPEIAAEAKRTVGQGNLWERIEPVCRFVQKEVPYLSVYIMTDSLAGYRPHAASEVLGNRYGDCKDKAVLLCALLDSLGIEARVTLVNSGHVSYNRAEWPTIQFNHAVVAIRAAEPAPAGWPVVKSAGADWVLFDPTNDEIPLGLFPPYNTGGLGLVLAPGVDAPVTIPALASPKPEQALSIELQLGDDGTAKVNVREERTGLVASDAINNEETVQQWERFSAYERRVTRRLPLVTGLVLNTTKDTKTHIWTSNASFTAPGAGKRISRSTLSVSVDLLSAVPSLDPWEEGTDGWFNLEPRASVRTVTVSAPANFEFVDLPEDWKLSTPAGEASIHLTRDNDKLTLEARLRVAGGVLDRAAYLDTRELLRSTLAAEHRPVLLRRRAAATPPPATAKS